MIIEKKIKLDNNIYYAIIEVEYEKHIEGFPTLRLKEYKSRYWDDGNCSLLIEKIETSYSKEKALFYDNNIAYMADILYIYDRVPFINGIKNTCNSSETYISKAEIEKYIEMFNIKIHNNQDFKLYDERTWYI